jgi:hypothetical protein
LVSFYFVFISLISFRFVSFLLISFRFVSFRFVFVDFVSFRFYFVSHFIGTRITDYDNLTFVSREKNNVMAQGGRLAFQSNFV